MNILKKALPVDSFEIRTTQSPEALMRILDRQIEPQKLFRFGSRNHKPFQGDLSIDGFTMTRIIHYRNSFLPVIRGTFAPGPQGTNIAIKMTLHPIVIAFMAMWLGVVGSIAMVLCLSAIFSNDVAWPLPLAPLGMFVFGWALTSGGFWFEAHHTKKKLLRLFR